MRVAVATGLAPSRLEHAVKDRYPPSSIPEAYLVPPELQPDYPDDPGVDLGTYANVADLLADAHVRAGRGKSICLIDAATGRSHTFAELASASDGLAARLVDLGLQAGDRVAYRSLNVPEVLVVVLATWKAGGVVVPTPAAARPGEVRQYLEDTQPRMLFVLDRAGLADGIGELAATTGIEQVLWIDESLWQSSASDASLPRTHADSVAIVWHTGGTTGTPKACYHTHRRYLLGGLSLGPALGVEPGQVWAAAAPVGHALGIMFHTVLTLLHGATVVLVPEFQKPEALLEAIERHRISGFAAITATWARMLEVLAQRPEIDTGSLTHTYAMWQSASSSAVRDGWRARGLELLNNFGSTSFATWVLVPRPGEVFHDTSLGRAIPGYTVLAVEPDSNLIVPVPEGEPGRMAVRGPTGLTYWRRPDYQARDVIHGWTLVDDMVRLDDRGYAEYLGRTDFLISTAGNKVSPVEVEAVLTSHDAVREAGVIGAPDDLRVEAVMAFVVLEPGVAPSDALVRELQDKVKTELSPYKYPRLVEFVDALPRDPVGKVQQGELKRWAASRAQAPSRSSNALV